MKIKNLFYLLLPLLLVTQAYGETSVWKVSIDGNELFIGGTIHVLSENDYPLPAEFEQAYEQSEIIVFETDMQSMNNPEVQQAMISAVTYKDGRNLQQDLSEETYLKLGSYLMNLGIPETALNSFKPGMVAVTVTVIELQRLGITTEGVDSYFSNKAVTDDKVLGQLETIEEQISFIAAMGEGEADELILSTLKDVKQLSDMMEEMVVSWRSGNTEALEKVFISELKQEFPEIYLDLIVKRNNAWFPQIEKMALNDAVEFILVGAAHLVGKDGILARLEAEGYTVENY